MKKKLGEILVAAGSVSRDDIDAALIDQSSGEPARLGELLVALGKISPLQLALALSEQYGVTFAEVPPVATPLIATIPIELQRQFRFVPIKQEGSTLWIAMADLSQAADVQPLLKKQFAKVHMLVAASDEIDAAHFAARGEDEVSVSPVQLPKIAPVIAPVRGGRAPHAPTADELFGSLGLDDPPAASARRIAEPPGEEEPFFFEAQTAALPVQSSDSVTVEVFEDDDMADVEVDVGEPIEPVRAAELLAAADLLDAPPESHDAMPFDAGPDQVSLGDLELPTAQLASLAADDSPFFPSASPADPVAGLSDDAFVSGVPASSPSSLAMLIIEPEVPVIPSVTPLHAQEQPAEPTQADLPEWLRADVRSDAGWTGALDHLAPSKLILLVTKALIRRGVLSEQDILDASAKK